MLPLTTDQQAYIDGLEDVLHAVKTALVQSLKTDNDRASTLTEASTKLLALQAARAALQSAALENRVGGVQLKRGDGSTAGNSIPEI